MAKQCIMHTLCDTSQCTETGGKSEKLTHMSENLEAPAIEVYEALSQIPSRPDSTAKIPGLADQMRNMPKGGSLLIRPAPDEDDLTKTQRRISSQGAALARSRWAVEHNVVGETFHTRIDREKNGVWAWKNASS